MDDVRIYARVYPTQAEARQAYETAIQDYVLGQALEVGFTLALLPGAGWIVVAVGRDASPGMLTGGTEVELPAEARRLFVQRFQQGRPSPHGHWIVRRSFPDGLAVRLPREH